MRERREKLSSQTVKVSALFLKPLLFLLWLTSQTREKHTKPRQNHEKEGNQHRSSGHSATQKLRKNNANKPRGLQVNYTRVPRRALPGSAAVSSLPSTLSLLNGPAMWMCDRLRLV